MKPLFEKSAFVRYLITSGETRAENYQGHSKQLLDQIRAAVESGFEIVQIREKRLSARLQFALGQAAVDIAHGSQTAILLNDRADIAEACGADGVHLPANSIPASKIREYFPNLLVGVSTHSSEEVIAASESGADFVTFGPVFRTPSKEKFGDPQGIDRLRSVCKAAEKFPVIAIGGIGHDNIKEIKSAGAGGIAAIRLFSKPERFI